MLLEGIDPLTNTNNFLTKLCQGKQVIFHKIVEFYCTVFDDLFRT